MWIWKSVHFSLIMWSQGEFGGILNTSTIFLCVSWVIYLTNLWKWVLSEYSTKICETGKLYFHNTKYFMNVPRETQTQWCFSLSLVWFWCLKPLSTIFHLYRGSQFYWGRKPDHPENHRPVACHLQMLSHNVVSSTPGLSRVRNHNASGDTYWLHR